MKKALWISVSIIVLFALCVIGTDSGKRMIGNVLINTDQIKKADVIFVLGGDASSRGVEAARLYHEGYADRIITTSMNVPTNFESVNIKMTECEITRKRIAQENVPQSKILAMQSGTSTKEEIEAIYKWCTNNNVDEIIVVSTLFHTNRIQQVIGLVDKPEGLDVMIHGAPSHWFDEANWWQSESGLIFVNNEYIKLIYYWWKY